MERSFTNHIPNVFINFGSDWYYLSYMQCLPWSHQEWGLNELSLSNSRWIVISPWKNWLYLNVIGTFRLGNNKSNNYIIHYLDPHTILIQWVVVFYVVLCSKPNRCLASSNFIAGLRATCGFEFRDVFLVDVYQPRLVSLVVPAREPNLFKAGGRSTRPEFELSSPDFTTCGAIHYTTHISYTFYFTPEHAMNYALAWWSDGY